MNHIQIIMILIVIHCGGKNLLADEASTPYENGRVNARLNVEVKEDTDVVHFVRTNADPDVVTKTYLLKHADPYELRTYLRELVQTRRVDESDTGITALKYKDGTGVIMISAEDYRFDDPAEGQGFDSLIKTLDQPGIQSVTGHEIYLYKPKYRTAKELKEILEVSGAHMEGDVTENIGGQDNIQYDSGLNLLLLRTTVFSKKNILHLLNQYDCPYPEIKTKITIYELNAENDGQIGLDFQSWKNNDGLNLFNTGLRAGNNYNLAQMSLNHTKWSDVQYFHFNPKWNSKYLDFLVTKGKAKIYHQCEMIVRNRITSVVDRQQQVFFPKSIPTEIQKYGREYIYLSNQVPGVDFTITIQGGNGELYDIQTLGAVTLTVLKLSQNEKEEFKLILTGGNFISNGKNYGSEIEAKWVEVLDMDEKVIDFTENSNLFVDKGNTINIQSSADFGFSLKMRPNISHKATLLDMQLCHSSLIGYQSDGSPRIQRDAKINSTFVISNQGTQLVIGGIKKKTVTRVSGGVPLLKDLPLLGWLFSTEGESSKNSQLVIVAEVTHVISSDPQKNDKIQEIDEALRSAGEKNTYGYRQILLDQDR